VFNNYFTNIGPELASSIDSNVGRFTDYIIGQPKTSLFFTPTNENEILKIVQSLESSKSCGHDEISANLLKKIIFYILAPLNYIFNLFLLRALFPTL